MASASDDGVVILELPSWFKEGWPRFADGVVIIKLPSWFKEGWPRFADGVVTIRASLLKTPDNV